MDKNGTENGSANVSAEQKTKSVNVNHENGEDVANNKSEAKDKLFPNRGYLSPSSDSSDSVFTFNQEKNGLSRQNSTNSVLSPNPLQKPEFYLDSNSNGPSLNQSKKRSLSPGPDPNTNKKTKEMNVIN